ncbi:MAG: O-antigen ligase family protein [Calditrichae bacterium]|nr:O-antigen ligase family protein [Calditrichia bacterium]
MSKNIIIPAKYSDLFAQIAFLLLLFFIIFGTSLPFREKGFENTTNPVNQIGFSLIIVLSAIALINHRNLLIKLILKEKFMVLFLIWCIASSMWSQDSFLTFKRWVQITAPFFASTAILFSKESSKNTLKYFEWILYPYLIASVLASLFIPQALDPQFHTWRGLTYTKNNLGQVGVVGIIVSAIAFQQSVYKRKVLALIMLMLSVLLLLGSRSMTSTATLLIVVGITTIMFVINKIFPFPNIAKFLISFTFVGILFSLFFILLWYPDFFVHLPELAGKDPTFTGRTHIWRIIVNEINKHPFIGCGYSSFWIFDSAAVELMQEKLFWLPNQSHNGYLDLINETGFIGFSLVILMVVKYFWILSKSKIDSQWKWIIVATIGINFLESDLFRPKHLTGTLFIFSYLAFYNDLMLPTDSENLDSNADSDFLGH